MPAATVNYGVDIIGTASDIDPYFRLTTGGIDTLVNALARRLATETLWYTPGYGLGIRGWLSRGLTEVQLNSLKSQIQAQCQLDERIATATAAVSFNPTTNVLLVTITATPSLGPTFTFVLSVTSVTVQLLSQST